MQMKSRKRTESLNDLSWAFGAKGEGESDKEGAAEPDETVARFQMTQVFDDESLNLFLEEQRNDYESKSRGYKRQEAADETERLQYQRLRGDVYNFLFDHRQSSLSTLLEDIRSHTRHEIKEYIAVSRERCSPKALAEASRSHRVLLDELQLSLI
jgi:hypothetical protein